jgi:hypothetical protein
MLGDDLVDDSSPRRCNEAAPLSTPKPRLVSLIRLGFFLWCNGQNFARSWKAQWEPSASRGRRGSSVTTRSLT